MLTFQKLWSMLTPSQHRVVIFLLGLMLIGMALEMTGLGLVFPILTLITNDNLASDYPLLEPWLDRLGNPGQGKLIIFVMLTFLGVSLIKILFLGLLAWQQSNLTLKINTNLSLRLFTLYLRQPYVFHLQRNSAELIRNAMGQVGGVVGAITSCMMITTESLVLLGILALMCFVEPVGTFGVAGTFGLTSWGFYRFTKKRINRWGEEYQHHEGLRIQYLQEGLGATKDIKLLGCEKEFIDRYQVHSLGSARIGKNELLLKTFPRFGLELLAVIGITLIVFIMIIQNRPMGSLVATLGLFTAASFRVMPSVSRLLSAFQSARFLLPVIHNLHKEFCLIKDVKPQKEHSPLLFEKALVLENISFQYPSAETLVLKEICLSIRQGESIGFIGSTGGGKSTLVDIILGLLVPVSGVVKVDGIDIQTNPRGWQDQIGYVPQTIFLTDDTIRRNIAFGLSDNQVQDAIIWNALRSAQLEQFVKNLPEGLDTQIGEGGVRLSGGQRQRVGIARALYHNPSVLVLDEATSALDTITESAFMDAVHALKEDKTLIIVAHRLTTLKHCDYLFKVESGKIIEEDKSSILLSKKS
jgi:ABC-type multidrug transport system fused ATPase/permease subunit